MPHNKHAYFQGGGGCNEPEPHHKKYKSEKAITVQPRFVEPFYRNYDVYETEGVDGPPKLGPGGGWHHMGKYKSISEFLAAKRKHMRDKYKADDFWIEDTESNRKSRIERMKTRAAQLYQIIKLAGDDNDGRNYDYGEGLYQNMDQYKSVSDFLGNDKAFTSTTQWRKKQDDNDIDFPLDEYTDPAVEEGIDEQADHNTNEIGGFLDKYLPEDDFEGKSPDQLNFGRDYDGELTEPKKKPKNVDELIHKYLNMPEERPTLELPQGIEEDELTQPNNPNGQYGETDSGNTFYDKMWI